MNQAGSTFGVEGLRVVEHASGLQQGLLSTEHCQGSFFLLGGHVAEYQPTGCEPVLFLSEASNYEVGKAIRGGVPICFPWFGPKLDEAGEVDPERPAHGLVRTVLWELTQARLIEDGALQVCLEVTQEDLHLQYWLTFGKSLKLSMHVSNRGSAAHRAELALHTYFRVADVSQVRIRGLEQVGYLDKLTRQNEPATGDAISFTKETDRVYQGEPTEILLEDPSLERTIRITPEGSRSTVVWNPWVDKSKKMPDFGDEEFHRMCCVETACVGPNPLAISPGETAVMSVEIAVV